MSQQTRDRPAVGRPEFVTLIAIYQFVTAGILLLLSCLIAAVIFPSIFVYVGATGGVFSGLVLATVALTLFLGFAFASVVVGWGLLRLREWARLGAIVLAAFALIGFPVWTIVAILILIYLTSQEGRSVFRPYETPHGAGPRADREAPTQAVYKAEPPNAPAEETRRIAYAGGPTTPPGATNGSPDEAVSADETGAVPMPPEDPAWATESLYDQEADVTDHYRRWKASLEQEPGGQEPPADEPGQRSDTEEAIEMPAPAPDESTEPVGEPDTETPPEEEGDIDERVRGPEPEEPPSTEQPGSANEDEDEPETRGRER